MWPAARVVRWLYLREPDRTSRRRMRTEGGEWEEGIHLHSRLRVWGSGADPRPKTKNNFGAFCTRETTFGK